MKNLIILFTLICVCGTVNAAKYYKWQDAEGVTHYGAQPPSGSIAETVNVTTGHVKPVDSNASAKPRPADTPKTAKVKNNGATQKNSKSENSEDKIPTEIREQNEKNCAQARKNLDVLNNRARVQITDEATGKLRYLTPDEHASWMLDAKDQIKAFCR